MSTIFFITNHSWQLLLVLIYISLILFIYSLIGNNLSLKICSESVEKLL